MSRIAEEADRLRAKDMSETPSAFENPDMWLTEAVACGAWEIVRETPAHIVAVGTHSGQTARVFSKVDMPIPILAASDDERACRRMALYRGVVPELVTGLMDLEQMLAELERITLEKKLAPPDGLIVIIGGVPFGKSGTTNTIQLRRLDADATEATKASSRVRWRFEVAGKTCDYAVDYLACIGCGICVKHCPYNIFTMHGERAAINEEHLARCILDRTCEMSCPTGAITIREVDEEERRDS
jgi:ferredoxin